MNEYYPLKPFRILSQDSLIAMMETYPLANVMTGPAGSALQSLLPLVVDQSKDNLFLLGHLDRNNPQTECLIPGEKVSFQFLGPSSYVSPDIYPSKQLPGWLYISVQGDGFVQKEVSGEELRELLVRSTISFGDKHQHFSLDPHDPRVSRFLPHILGFCIEVIRISGIAKLAQDKGADDAHRALEFLASQNNEGGRRLFERLLDETL